MLALLNGYIILTHKYGDVYHKPQRLFFFFLFFFVVVFLTANGYHLSVRYANETFSVN